MSVESKVRAVTTLRLKEMKDRGEKIAMLTSYDYSMAKIVDAAGVDVILVGDSAANVMAGYETTVPITLDAMIYHARSVVRAVERALVVVDLPFWYDFRAGFLWAPQRDRIADEGWKAPMGGELRVRLGWKGLEFENNLYVGENLMPLFGRYGSELYAGERWYGTRDRIYNRTRLGYERSFASETIRVQAGMIFHTDGTGLYTQQVVQVSVRLGKTLYDQRNHPQR